MDAAPDAPGGDGLHDIQQRAQDLLDAGDEAINRALSGDSTRFLRANRQLGGQ
jgi:hypothetical protein